MYKILIADDEGIVIDSFKYMLEERFGDEVSIESAKTGRNVIELAERFRPDIALMDIRMPGINGIDAIREIRKRNPGIVFIVISAYDEFGYAQDAMSLGVMEYLNKPVARDKFIDTIQKAMEKVDSERSQRSKELEIMEKLETVTPIIESGLIYNLLFQEFFKEDLINFKTVLDIEDEYGFMIALIFGEQQEGAYMTNAIGTSVKIQQHIHDLREIVKSYFHCVIGPVMGNKVAVFVPFASETCNYNERIEIINKSREMVHRLNSQISVKFRAGIGPVRPIDKQIQSYNDATESLTLGQGSVANSDDMAVGCEYEEDYPIELENAIFDSIPRGEVDKTVVAANRFFDWMMDNYKDYMDDVRLKVLEFVLRAESVAYIKCGKTYHFRSREDYLSIINKTKNYDELRDWFVNRLTDACHSVQCRKENRTSSVVEKAKEYVQKKYSKDISLDDVSREINISPYYFSKLFKDETGENFIDYITSLRIEKAKELLDQTDMSMKEICSEVGYANPNYFSRIFKKCVGVSPTEYKA